MTRKNINKQCEKFDIQSLQLIQNKLSCAAQSARPDAIPDGIDGDKAKLFISAAIDSLGTYRWLENDWWETAKTKYDLPRDVNVWIDFVSGDFYITE